MDTAQATVLKEQLKAIAAGHGDGIALDTPERWVIEDIRDRTMFFKHLGLLIPADSILYIEGADIASDVAKFYEAHRAVSGAARVMRDMICPVPEIFHLRVGPELIHG